jgi:hypothetical protein
MNFYRTGEDSLLLLDGFFLARDAFLGEAGFRRLLTCTVLPGGELGLEQFKLPTHAFAELLVEETAFTHGN